MIMSKRYLTLIAVKKSSGKISKKKSKSLINYWTSLTINFGATQSYKEWHYFYHGEFLFSLKGIMNPSERYLLDKLEMENRLQTDWVRLWILLWLRPNLANNNFCILKKATKELHTYRNKFSFFNCWEKYSKIQTKV